MALRLPCVAWSPRQQAAAELPLGTAGASQCSVCRFLSLHTMILNEVPHDAGFGTGIVAATVFILMSKENSRVIPVC